MKIINHIIGGLGNQMFQYAVGRALSLTHQVPLLLDISDFDHYPLHQGFELAKVFCCPINLADASTIASLLTWQSSKSAVRLLSIPQLRILRNHKLIIEPHFHYWSAINTFFPPYYLKGYWQSERYFAEQAQTIRAEFKFKTDLTGKNLELANKIKSLNAVSIHIRRGDYLNNPKTLSLHGICSLNYYHQAISNITNNIEQPHFLVFSDDMDWVAKNLILDYPCDFIDHNQGADSFNDLHLMSLCKHHIIANSSFSWWGAWLNQNPDKIVIAPKKWFVTQHNNTKDLIPETWITL